jgi:hypothetical protein
MHLCRAGGQFWCERTRYVARYVAHYVHYVWYRHASGGTLVAEHYDSQAYGGKLSCGAASPRLTRRRKQGEEEPNYHDGLHTRFYW